MPKVVRLSPSYERRRAQRHSSNHSTGSSGLPASPELSMGIASESYVRIKKKGALTWSTRYLILRNSQLVWFACKQDADYRRAVQEVMYLRQGTVTPLKNELGLAMTTEDGREFVARAFNRGDLARWITAFQRLALKKEAKASALRQVSEAVTESTSISSTEENPVAVPDQPEDKLPQRRHVSFHTSVHVRVIPTVTEDQIEELFYSKKDMEKFSAQASSLFWRTEEAVSCAYQAIRRPSSNCRKEVL